jgi:PPOX class probable F420-dependent enzyme
MLAPGTSGSWLSDSGGAGPPLPQPPSASPQPVSARTSETGRAPSLGARMRSSANVAELPRWAVELIEGSRVGHLGVVDDAGSPRVLPATYALVGGRLVSAVDQKPKRVPGAGLARVRWLRARPTAAFTIDHYEDEWARLAWVQLLGHVELLELAEASEELSALSRRYPQYRGAPPPGPVIVLTPARILWWRAV